jgi:2-polyprenyl-3-methyl-5-hydroxy-6-metoxy-1,4-benzoquinol methylase
VQEGPRANRSCSDASWRHARGAQTKCATVTKAHFVVHDHFDAFYSIVVSSTRTRTMSSPRTPSPDADVTDLSEQVRVQEPEPAQPADEAGSAPEHPGLGRGFTRAVPRALLWPLRRFFDPRISGLAQAIEVTKGHLSQQLVVQSEEVAAVAERGLQTQDDIRQVRTLVEADLEAATEATTVIGQSLNEVRSIAEATEAALGRIEGRLTPEAYRQLADEGRVEELDGATARFLNYASSYRGFAAQRNLWFNWPVSITYEPQNVTLGNVNERIAEVAYAFRALSGVKPGARILDVGASESTVALSLASLGYEVTAIDPRPYPLEHPRLRVVVGGVEAWNPGETFAAVICISTVEHIGSGEYGQAAATSADADALRRLHTLLERDGLLVLTTPYGNSQHTEGARVYDKARLETLLADWSIEDFTVIGREDAITWSPTNETPVGEAVALITARRNG